MVLSVPQRGNIFLVVVVCLLAVGICAPFSGHDLQRVMQIAIGLCAVLYGLSVAPAVSLVDRPTALGLALIIGLGLVSSALAHQPVWALIEVALFVSCAAITLAFALLRRHGGESLDRVLILIVVLLCLIKSIQYLYAGALAFTSGERTLDPDLLLSGFSNKRFYGQFQTFTLPLLALPLLMPTVSRVWRGGRVGVAVRLVADSDQRWHARHLARHERGGAGARGAGAGWSTLAGVATGGGAGRAGVVLAGIHAAGAIPGVRDNQGRW